MEYLDKMLSTMALELADLRCSAEAIGTVTQYARAALNGDDAGVMLMRARSRIETPAGTSSDVDKAHQLQTEFDEGPCLDAARGTVASCIVDDVPSDQRWPSWGKATADLGYHSVVSASMHTAAQRIGSLNVYSRTMNAFDDSDVAMLGLLSGHATLAIAAVEREQQLQRALENRTTIGQAQGILMHAFDIDATRAFAYLQRQSQAQNVKLIRIAETVIENPADVGTDTSR